MIVLSLVTYIVAFGIIQPGWKENMLFAILPQSAQYLAFFSPKLENFNFGILFLLNEFLLKG